MSMNIQKISKEQVGLFENLSQDYEAEFAPLTGARPNSLGNYPISTPLSQAAIGYILFFSNRPAGFCVVETSLSQTSMAEFYIVPEMRRQGLGASFAFHIFNLYPGSWEVKELEGAKKAIAFWRSTIKDYTNGSYEEKDLNDSRWGPVICQTFEAT